MDRNPIANDVADNPFAWPGGYPRFAVTDDGGVLCPACCASEYDLIARAAPGNGWHVTGHGINWEDPALHCDHCNQRIESAYAEDV